MKKMGIPPTKTHSGPRTLLNGRETYAERYLPTRHQVVRASPPQHAWRRPTWTREMLVETLVKETGLRIRCPQ